MTGLSMFSSNAGACTKKRSRILLAALIVSLVQTLLVAPAFAQVNRDRWMGDLVTKYGANPSPMDQTLAEFIFPGTSNSGSYGTKLLPACDSCRKEPLKFYTDTPLLGIVAGLFLQDWAITQTANIEGQLSLGARVLDLRFFRVTPADNQYMQGFVDLLISLGIGDIIALPATDGYYTHNTFAGPSSTEIFEHVRNFLVDGTGVPIPGREREIIILNFSEMLKGNGEMTADDLNAIFDQLISTVGIQTFAESSLTDSAMLATLQAAGKQIIVSYDGNVPVAALDPAIRPYIWPKIVAQGFDDFNPPGTSFPRADTWNTEGRLFGEMEMLALERVNLDATSQLFQMNVSMGADDASDFPDMITRRLLCNLPTVYSDVSAYYDPLELLTDLLGIKSPPAGTTDPTEFEQLIETLLGTVKDSINGALGLAAFEAFMDDVLGICPAINDDWDRFTSLEEVAGFTNPKLLPSLVGLPRDTVNIVLVDHYPGEFTDEANKLNQGATRVSVVITKVEERECHDCVPFTALRLSNPDYYPEITFFPKNVSGSIVPDVWGYYKSPVDVVEANTPEFGVFQEAILLPNLTEAGQTEHESHWGGPWLETSATRITPYWRAVRALSPDTPQVDVKIRIWDQDNNICYSIAPLFTWCGWDDLSRIDGSNTSVTETVVSWVGTQPKTDDAVPTILAKPVRNVVRGPSTNCSLDDLTSWPPTCSINLDSSVVHYGTYSCLWAPVPGEDFNQFFACDPPSANAAPVAVVDFPGFPAGASIDEGFKLEASGRLSFDPNDCPPEGHPNYSPGCINYDILGNWIDEVVEYEWDCNHDPVPVCLNDAIADDYNPTGGSACPVGYTETNFVPGRGCRKPTILAEAHPYCDFLPEPCTWGGVPSKIRFAAYDGPADQQVALRVTDFAGKKSIPTVASFLVDNSAPIITGHEVVQEPGTSVVTSTIEFIDYSADDSQFRCSVQVNGPGDLGLFPLDGAEVEGESYFDDNFGVTAVSYRCSLTFPFQFLPGVYTFLPEVEDKDFAKSPGVQATHFSRELTFVPPAVTNAGDSGAGSLRDAIANASPGDVLGFDLSLSGQTITLVSGAIILDKDLTIDASSLPDGLTISGNNTSRVFEKSGAASTAVLKGLTITAGRDDFRGGCIYQSTGELTLIDSTVHNCFTPGQGGGIYSWLNNAGLFLENSTITGNLSVTAGGIYIGFNNSGSRFSMVHSTISGNTAVSPTGVGGLVYDVPTCMDVLCLTIENSIIAGNFHPDTTSLSPDISINAEVASETINGNNLIGNHWGVQSYFPAGLLVGTAADPLDPLLHPLKDSGGPTPTMLPRTGSLAINQAETFADSPSRDQRGFLRLVDGYSDLGAVEKQAFDVDDNDDDGFGNPTDNCVNIANPDQLDFDSDGEGNVCDTTATITILGDGSPGSLRDVIGFAPSGAVIDFDPAASGGSVVLTGGDLVVDKELTIDASSLPLGLTLSGNNASRVFDVTAVGNLVLNGLTISDGQSAIAGGCILNQGVLDIVDSTVTGCDSATSGGAISNSGAMTLTNATVSGNSQGALGAILNNGDATLIHSTIADNHSSGEPASASGGIFNQSVLNIENSIVAGNTGGVNPDIFHSSGTINASGLNLVGDNSSVTVEFPTGPLVGTAGAPLDPGLVQLLNFGGPNPTMLPLSISPAVDSAITTPNSPMNDQRGFARPAGAANDLGAVERQTFDVDDIDGDGVLDPVDNCPTVSNLDQLDFDSDGEGNVCDLTATITVLGDGSPGSLRDVIDFAPSGAVIDFDPAASGGSIVLTGGDLVVDKELTIDASSLPLGLMLSGNNASRVFDVTAVGNLALNGLTIRDSQADAGGCIRSLGVLDIVDSTVTGCSADVGGGIYSNGSMTMTNSTVSGNIQDGWGAVVIAGNATLVHSTISDNHSLDLPESAVGGISNFGVLNIENSIVAGNTGGVTPDIRAVAGTINAFGSNLVGDNSSVTAEFPAGPLVGTGGAPLDPGLAQLLNSGGPNPTMLPLSISPAVDSAITTPNSPMNDQRGFARPVGAANDLGAVERQTFDVDDIDGDGVLDPVDNCPTVSNLDQLDIDSDGEGNVCDAIATIAILGDGSPGSLRDAVNLLPSGTVIDFDLAASGATIVLTGGDLVVDKELTIDASSLPLGLTLSGNNASRVFDVTAAGNLALNGLTIRDGQADVGGCIQAFGVLDIVDSTVTACSADFGGGIFSQVSMTMTNSTVSGNDQDGWGAIAFGGNATLVHSTISDNHSLDLPASAVGGIGNFGVLNIENSIVAGNTGGVIPDIRADFGTINAFGSNLVGDNSSVAAEFPAGPLVGTAAAPLNPGLNVLGNYGGPTPTMTPIDGSPAVDAAIATGNSPATDQRGVTRPEGLASDLGAVERQASDVDIDTDADTVPDAIDNCPLIANASQLDTNGDGRGNACSTRGDHNGGGKADILWRDSGTGQNWMYLMDGPTIATSAGINTVTTDWKIAGNKDYDGDGRADILWRHSVTGQIWMYLMDGATIVNSVGVRTVPTVWDIAGQGDYNGDGKSDLLWRHSTTGQNWIYFMDGPVIASVVGVNTVPVIWEIAGNGDYNGDGKSDILWRHSTTGQNWMYLMDGATISSILGINTVPTNWNIVGSYDYNGDGKSDILWRDSNTGQSWMYFMDSATIASSVGVNTVPTIWDIAGQGDYNGDGKTDLLWRHGTTGQNWIYTMDGATITSIDFLNKIPTSWEITHTE